ncbi:MAG: GNAT family N-acetyltransferase [Candidatus Methanomethylophilaceae archaeon]|nr:GNAT family N-acetyltransferase [Candidatus Methanomethylophilaceae archaeon]
MIRTRHLLTERLELRMFTMEDVRDAHRNWMTDPDVTHFLTWDVHGDVSETARVISAWIDQYPAGSMDWCITLRGSTEPIGSITAVRDHPDEGYCEIGYCLSQRYWDNGYMTEAIRAIVRYIFDTTCYGWIQARHEVENEASGRCLEKCNFREWGRREMVNPKTGRTCTYRFMGIRRGDLLLM